jgi:hypothetical protein
MNTSPHTTRRGNPHAPSHDNPKHNLPLNPGHKLAPSSRPSSSKLAPRTQSPPSHPPPQSQTQPQHSPTYTLSPVLTNSSKAASRIQSESPPAHSPPPHNPPHLSTTYVLSPGPTKPTIPTPWQHVEELSLIQRELTAELLATQGKNKGLVVENASLRERVSQLGILFIPYISFLYSSFFICLFCQVEQAIQVKEKPSRSYPTR